MNKIGEAVFHLNHDQITVITADQPMYALAKKNEWKWPEQYGEDKYFIMFGGVHIEMAAF